MNSKLARSERGRWVIPVPWDRAGVLHRRLAQMGYSSILVLNAECKESRLELAPEVEPEEALQALAGACAPRAVVPA